MLVYVKPENDRFTPIAFRWVSENKDAPIEEDDKKRERKNRKR